MRVLRSLVRRHLCKFVSEFHQGPILAYSLWDGACS
jgi:hypothetical protein